MSMIDLQSGLSGMMGSLETQKMATELMQKTVQPEMGEKVPALVNDNQSDNTMLAKAVPGLGDKLDVSV